MLLMEAGSGVPSGSSSSLMLLSELKFWNGIVIMEPAPLACFGSEYSLVPLSFRVLKQYLVGLETSE